MRRAYARGLALGPLARKRHVTVVTHVLVIRIVAIAFPPRLVLVLHGRREERVRCRAEERVGVDLMLPGVHGHPPVQHLHRIGAQALWGKGMRGRGCGAIGAGYELSTSRSWCSILESSVTSSRLNTSCTRLCR